MHKPDANGNGYSDSYLYSDSYSDADGNVDAYSDVNAHGYDDSQADAHAKASTDAKAAADTSASSVALSGFGGTRENELASSQLQKLFKKLDQRSPRSL